MSRPALMIACLFCFIGSAGPLPAQQQTGWEIDGTSDQSTVEYEFATGITTATNGVIVRYSGAVLTADRISLNQESGDVTADGRVRIQREEQIWASEHLNYNFKTRQIQAEQFRTGKQPVYAAGEGLHADLTNRVYAATNALITTEDIAEPLMKIRARSIRIIPGQKLTARDATLYIGEVPVFYFPFYTRNLGPRSNNIHVMPGYRSRYGGFLLGTYTWWLNDQLDGVLHLDYRTRRGVGLGPDFNYHLGRWGEGSIKYYYAHDENPDISLPDTTPPYPSIPADRQRVYLGYLAHPATNLSARSMVRYQTDWAVVRDFFESEYRDNSQPSTFLEVNKHWRNFSLDAYAQPRVNEFLETVERLPDVRLTGFRQQIGVTPVYYESESSAGWYRRLFAETNGIPAGLDYSAARADTFHQLLLPRTFFGWLNVEPRAGGRFTYYSDAAGPGEQTDEVYRGIFNTGAELNFKASRTWPGLGSRWLEVDGLRHILQPSFNYAYIPTPNVRGTNEIPQFDYEMQSLRLLPIDFPDYNAIDVLNQGNVIRLGLRNKLQTKRKGEVGDLLYWDLYTDWRLDHPNGQTTFSDVFSDAAFRPRSWVTLESLNRYDVDNGHWRMAFHSLTLQPNDIWSWRLAHYYLRDDERPPPVGLGNGNNLFMSTVYLRVNENWGLRASQHFEAKDGRMEEQSYGIYRDLRSWTAALSFRLRDNRSGQDDFTVAFTFSLKAYPRYGLGSDTVRPYTLLGL